MLNITELLAPAGDMEPYIIWKESKKPGSEVFVHGALCICYSGQCQMSVRSVGGAATGENSAAFLTSTGRHHASPKKNSAKMVQKKNYFFIYIGYMGTSNLLNLINGFMRRMKRG
jgi:hypothetical protein